MGIGYRFMGIGYRFMGIGYRFMGIGYRKIMRNPCNYAGCSVFFLALIFKSFNDLIYGAGRLAAAVPFFYTGYAEQVRQARGLKNLQPGTHAKTYLADERRRNVTRQRSRAAGWQRSGVARDLRQASRQPRP